MARESKRKRDEKRFGKPESLADKIVAGTVDLGAPSWAVLPPAQLAEWVNGCVARCREMISESPVVVADNVAQYHYSVSSKTQLDWMKDFPNCRPPFSSVFLEFSRPPFYRDETGCVAFSDSFPEQCGYIIDTLPASKLPKSTGVPEADAMLLPMVAIPGVSYILRFVGVELLNNALLAGALTSYVPIAETGEVVGEPKTLLQCSNGADRAHALEIIENRGQFLQVAMLAISFMNFQNVSIKTTDPDARQCRERQKAGLKPFLRYHTIDIGPIREVLRTQGQVETRGLKHALHQCRGHFAVYTTSFMGRVLDKPMIVWRPAHLRGSAKEGVVVSGYSVDPPNVEKP